MELYYKDLISEDATLDKLVDQLSLVVQGAEEFARVAGEEGQHVEREALTSRLERLKEGCRNVGNQARKGARITDRALRRNPYSFAGVALVVGLAAGIVACRLMSPNKRS